MIAVDYRGSRSGFAFYVAMSHTDDRLATALRAGAKIDLDNMTSTGNDGGWRWDGSGRCWIVQRWAWDSFQAALRSAYPDDMPSMTASAESAAIEDFIDVTLKREDDKDQQVWALFGIRTDAHWNIAIVAARAIVWSHIEAIRLGRDELRLTPYNPKSVVVGFTKLHRLYGEPMIPQDLVELLRRLAGATTQENWTKKKNFPAQSRADVQLVQTFSNWEKRMAPKILKKEMRA